MSKWKNIKTFEKNYKISDTGDVLKLGKKKARYLKPILHNNYLVIKLTKNGKQINKLLHRLVAEHFFKNFKPNCHIYHIDGNIYNNNINNLGIGTNSKSSVKEKNYLNDKLYDIIKIIKLNKFGLTIDEIREQTNLRFNFIYDIINNRFKYDGIISTLKYEVLMLVQLGIIKNIKDIKYL